MQKEPYSFNRFIIENLSWELNYKDSNWVQMEIGKEEL